VTGDAWYADQPDIFVYTGNEALIYTSEALARTPPFAPARYLCLARVGERMSFENIRDVDASDWPARKKEEFKMFKERRSALLEQRRAENKEEDSIKTEKIRQERAKTLVLEARVTEAQRKLAALATIGEDASAAQKVMQEEAKTRILQARASEAEMRLEKQKTLADQDTSYDVTESEGDEKSEDESKKRSFFSWNFRERQKELQKIKDSQKKITDAMNLLNAEVALARKWIRYIRAKPNFEKNKLKASKLMLEIAKELSECTLMRTKVDNFIISQEQKKAPLANLKSFAASASGFVKYFSTSEVKMLALVTNLQALA